MLDPLEELQSQVAHLENQLDKCPACDGNGHTGGDEPNGIICPVCGGSGLSADIRWYDVIDRLQRLDDLESKGT